MPFDLQAVNDQDLGRILNKLFAKESVRVISANKNLLARSYHVKTQFRLRQTSIVLKFTPDGIYLKGGSEENKDSLTALPLLRGLRCFFNEISVQFEPQCDLLAHRAQLSTIRGNWVRFGRSATTNWEGQSLARLQEVFKCLKADKVRLPDHFDEPWTETVSVIGCEDRVHSLEDIPRIMDKFGRTSLLLLKLDDALKGVDVVTNVFEAWKGQQLNPSLRWIRFSWYHTTRQELPLAEIREQFGDFLKANSFKETQHKFHFEERIKPLLKVFTMLEDDRRLVIVFNDIVTFRGGSPKTASIDFIFNHHPRAVYPWFYY